MGKLLKYAVRYWKSVLVILMVLVLQAYCELSLPAYTSDIVNVGIQQGGIEETVPHAVPEEEMDRILLFIPLQEEKQEVLDAYYLDEDTYDTKAYVLKDTVQEDEESVEHLASLMGVPMMIVQGFSSGSEQTKQVEEQLMSAVPKEMLPEDADVFDVLSFLPEEQMGQMLTEIQEQMADMPDTIVDQAAVVYI